MFDRKAHVFSRRRDGFVLRALVLFALCCGLSSLGACKEAPPSLETDTGQSALRGDEGHGHAPVPPAPFVVSFALTYPMGADLKRATVGARASLEIGTNVKVLATDAAPGMVTSTGR